MTQFLYSIHQNRQFVSEISSLLYIFQVAGYIFIERPGHFNDTSLKVDSFNFQFQIILVPKNNVF